MHRPIGNIWQRPGLGLQPLVGPHQEHTHRRTIHDPIGDVFEPVIIPLEAVIKQVKGSLRSKVEFAYRTLSDLTRAVSPSTNDEQLTQSADLCFALPLD